MINSRPTTSPHNETIMTIRNFILIFVIFHTSRKLLRNLLAFFAYTQIGEAASSGAGSLYDWYPPRVTAPYLFPRKTLMAKTTVYHYFKNGDDCYITTELILPNPS